MAAQATQFTMTKGSESMNVQPDDLAAYLAGGWSVTAIKYSEGGEAPDAATQFLMRKSTDQISVLAKDLQTYVALGYAIVEVKYGASQLQILAQNGNISYLDTPALSSAEVGTVAATKVAVTFTTEVTASDYAAGVTIEVDTVSKTISAAERQPDHKVVHYTIPAVAFGEVVTWSYDDATGGITSAADGSPLDDVTDAEVTNNVPE
jgi:hypothetical protein